MVSINDVLKASKGVYVEDTFAQLWGRKLSSDYTIAVYTGTLPVTLMRTKAGYLQRYKVYGNSSGGQECGERTENLCYAIVAGASIDTAGKIVANNQYCLAIARVSQDMIVSCAATNTMYAWYATEPSIGSTAYNSARYVANLVNRTSPIDGYVAVRYWRDATDGMIVEGSTAPTSYEPYGYKLPLTSGSTPVDIFLGDDTLSTEEYVDSGIGKIYRMVDGVLTPTDPPLPLPQIPTSANSTTISWAGEGLAPSEVEFEYERK